MSCSADEDESLQSGDEFSFTMEETKFACSSPDIEFGDGVSAVLESLSVANSPSSYSLPSIHGKDSTVRQYEDMLDILQNKFNSLYTHCCNLADELEEKDEAIALMKMKLSWIKRGDKAQQDLCKAQERLAKSTLALASREQKTKLITWNNSLHYTRTEPRPVVRDEMASASLRLRQEQDKAEIAILAATVDRIAKHYGPDRYDNVSTIIDLSQPRLVCDPANLPKTVPRELMALWLYQVEPSQEEEQMYEQYLRQELRPPPVHSPPLPRPFVNWSKLNPFQLKNLPVPERYPILGCSRNPSFYTATEKDPDVYMGGQVLSWGRHCYPFGSLFGFSTNMGIVGVPTQPMHGYRCGERDGKWMIDARG